MTLSNNQLKFLRGRCHDLKPVVSLGQKGITEALLAELELALEHHELVKIKLGVDDRELRKQIIAELCTRSQAESVQVIGKTVSLYRANQKKPLIELPKK